MAIQGNKKDSKILDIRTLPSVSTDISPHGAFEAANVESLPDYPIDPTEISGGADGINFAAGDLEEETHIAEFVLVTEYDDYLLCSYYTEKVYIAKPPMLRISKYDGLTYDGKTFTRQGVNELLVEDAVGSEDDETWLISTDYVVGDIITAINHRSVIKIAGPETYWQQIESNKTWSVEQ